MRDFLKVLTMLVLVFVFMGGAAYMVMALNAPTMAILQIVIGVAVIILVIKNFDNWFGPRY